MSNLVDNKAKISNNSEALLAMVFHDIKNPVSAGIMAVKLLENPELSPLNSYQKELIENLSAGFGYMKNLLENFIEKYRYDYDKPNLSKSKSDFIVVVNDVVEELKYIFINKSQCVKVKVDIKNSLLNFDVIEIKRVIQNLLLNASKYSPENSEISICLKEDKKFVYFKTLNKTVLDVSTNEVFDLFAVSNGCSKSVATGLGLYIVKRIITAHNGEISMRKLNNGFLEVVFTLPKK